ncbi:hypothetical protein QFC22_004371 [Naganishia vaughanmartiniae]|uniref:Uncharacterized protein n=1 Tax=Naganishia vaughanmartiniae TaxID=1424756 RepID=A0ACC2X396_9TREE|nr:hypothetical protein QFC22_004371 [Naganishia vaughanmartiniae]
MSKHAQCSEPFYASAIREAIRSDSASSSDEKNKMMEMLARFERGESEGGGSGDGSTVNGLEELLKGMGGISENDESGGAHIEEEDDEEGFEALMALKMQLSENPDLASFHQLENMDMQDLVNLLPPAHRDEFLSLLSNPDADQVQRLLGSLEESDRKAVENESLPWFLTSERGQAVEEEDGETEQNFPEIRTKFYPKPAPTTVTEGLKVNPSIAIKLLYNTLAICMAYVHLLVTHALPSLQYTPSERPSSSDSHQLRAEVLDEFLDLVPFLGDKESTLRYTSVKEAWEDVWTRIGSRQTHKGNAEENVANVFRFRLIHMLEKTQKLLVPSLDLGKASEHGVNLVLSDLYAAFSATEATLFNSKSGVVGSESVNADRAKFDKRHQKRRLAAAKKLVFYLGALQSIRLEFDRKVWLDLSAEVEKTIIKLKSETDNKGVDDQDPNHTEGGPGLVDETIKELSDASQLQSAPISGYADSPRPRARIEEL